MKRKRHPPQKVIAKRDEEQADLQQGATIEAVCRKLEISEQTFIAGGISMAGCRGRR
jgi:hypothetical protein